MRLIDADALIERWNNMSVRGRTEFDQEIMVAPSIDICFCKKCKYRKNRIDYKKDYCIKHSKVLYDTDGGCSWGEREGE